MKCQGLLLLGMSLLLAAPTWAQQRSTHPTKRAQLLAELHKCVHPGPPYDCDETSVYKVARLYQQGDKSVLPKLMDVAPHSDGAISEALGDFFSDLLCTQPKTFLQAVATRPQAQQDKLILLTAAADGSGMGCKNLALLRQRLLTLSRQKNEPLAKLAKRCLAFVNEQNPRS